MAVVRLAPPEMSMACSPCLLATFRRAATAERRFDQRRE
jgi:hypothetical protein